MFKMILHFGKRRLFVEKFFALEGGKKPVELSFGLGENPANQAQRKLPPNDGELLQWGFLVWGEAINARFDAMMAAGALEEVRALLALDLSGELPVMRALGVAPLAAHLAGSTSLEAAVAAAKTETRQYAKRQLTWLRRNMISWKKMDAQQMERIDRNNFPFSEP
jgi:tRNA A37 N6-isopentenylltransferase MiaA